MEYFIARPINGISINGNEYLLDENNRRMRFKTREECLDFIKKNITEKSPEDYLWEEEITKGEK
tara:strand:- start:6191 stop:6382 length:192 start_codon:yes stop_codon:yes gene_type:complete